jgi:4-carboxymuconolactone decarboxylase
MDERERLNEGMTVRRAVHGDAHVDRSVQGQNDFNGEFLDLLTRYAWGEIWSRPGLDRRTRSLLCLATMIALNRADEFKLHIRSALNIGVTRAEIKEVLLQSAVYAGIPAANSAFHWAAEVFAQVDASSSSES